MATVFREYHRPSRLRSFLAPGSWMVTLTAVLLLLVAWGVRSCESS